MELLFLLVERRGELVTREEVADRLWGTTVFVDIDQSINTAVRKVRMVLRDDPDKPHFIETVVGKGYRFAAPVAVNGEATVSATAGLPALPQPAQAGQSAAIAAAPAQRMHRRPPVVMLLTGIGAVLAIFASGWVAIHVRNTGSSTHPGIKSLVVLPLKNLSGDPAQEYLADGMTEALVSRLSSIHDLRVISRTSSMRLKNSNLSVPEIANALQVDVVVEGSVIREGNRIRVTAQLIRGTTDEHFWSETYDRELPDVLALQSDVAQAIARKVEVTVTGKEEQRLTASHTVLPEAYESYLKGRSSLSNNNTKAGIEERIRYFEEAIAKAFGPSLEQVREANMLLGDIGETALLASRNELSRAELSLFRPIKCMLATPEPTAKAVWERFAEAAGTSRELASSAPTTVYLEDKFDGIRAQLHRSTEQVEIFSRDLRRITGQFPELADEARNFQEELIIDGEIIAFEKGRGLTFFDLQKRLGRRSDGADLFARAAADVPVTFVIFDLLWFSGRSLLKTPLHERRRYLSSMRLPARFQIAKVMPAHSAAEIEQTFQQARQRLNEGLMIKNPESFYLPGNRGMFWFKLKKELATLDVVVVGAEFGHGKRNNVLSDYTFAVRDESTGKLLPIGKAYSGLTDVEIAELTEHFKQNTITDHGRYREVKPDVILEVAFNSIQPSPRHASGLALRFPRIKAIRRDKNVDSIDTLQYARELAAQRATSQASLR